MGRNFRLRIADCELRILQTWRPCPVELRPVLRRASVFARDKILSPAKCAKKKDPEENPQSLEIRAANF
jgi:hypothetical protein